MSEKRKPRFILPPNKLKEKVGEGGIPAEKLNKAQAHITTNKVDFTPEGHKHLGTLNNLIHQAGALSSDAQRRDMCEEIILEVMQLKAHGGMFHFGLISMVSDVVLQFLEKVKTINGDVLTILTAYGHTLKAILENGMRGDGGQEGMALAWELEQACERYFKRHNSAA